MTSTVLELSGPDRSGKDTLSLAIDKRYKSLDMWPTYSHIVVHNRSVYDFAVLDMVFNRTDLLVMYDRLRFLGKNKSNWTVVYLIAPVEELDRRQNIQIAAGQLDGSAYNKHIVDMQVMHDTYEEMYEAFKNEIDIRRFDTSKMTPDEIANALAVDGIID